MKNEIKIIQEDDQVLVTVNGQELGPLQAFYFFASVKEGFRGSISFCQGARGLDAAMAAGLKVEVEKMADPACPKCDGTGIWDTGNNDIPCPCKDER